MSSYVHNPMKNLYSSKYQIISLVFFAVFFISLFFPWYNAPVTSTYGASVQYGTLVFTKFAPTGILLTAILLASGIIAVLKPKTGKIALAVSTAVSAALYAVSVLVMQNILKTNAFSSYIDYAFYIGTTALLLTTAFGLIALIESFHKENVHPNGRKRQITTLVFFGVFVVLLFPNWLDTGVKAVSGTLLFSALFPIGILAAAAFVLLQLASFFSQKANHILVHVSSGAALIVLYILAIRTLIYFGGPSEMIHPACYISISGLLIATLLQIMHMCNWPQKV